MLKMYSRSESEVEINVTAIGSEKRKPCFCTDASHPEVKESEMADMAQYCVTSPKEDPDETAGKTITDDFTVTPKLLHDRDNSGEWKNAVDTNWYTESLKNNENNADLSTESITEWKYKNLYSVSARTGGLPRLPRFFTAGRTAALTNGSTDITENRSELDIPQGEKSILITIREYLASYQELYGVPRTEYSFTTLIKVMGQATGRSLLALLYVILNITPMAQVLLHILRFILDKTISIQNTNDFHHILVKYAILGLQLLCIYVCLVFIFGCIVMPILYMAFGIITTMTLYN